MPTFECSTTTLKTSGYVKKIEADNFLNAAIKFVYETDNSGYADSYANTVSKFTSEELNIREEWVYEVRVVNAETHEEVICPITTIKTFQVDTFMFIKCLVLPKQVLKLEVEHYVSVDHEDSIRVVLYLKPGNKNLEEVCDFQQSIRDKVQALGDDRFVYFKVR